METPNGASQNDLGMIKQWQKVQCELPKIIMNFSEAIINSISTYGQLMDFAVKCDIPTNWVERAKEDNPHNLEMVMTKVYFEWWGQCNLNVGKKLQMIQAAFAYMGKPAVFNGIMGRYPDLQMLLKYAQSNTTPALTGGDGVIKTNKTIVLESPDDLGLEFIKTGQITPADFEMIHHLAMVIRTEYDYTNICDSLGVPLEYGPLAIPKYSMWMPNRSHLDEILFKAHELFI